MLIKMDSEGTEQKFTQKGRFATRELVKNQNGEWETSSCHTVHGSQMLATHINSTSRRTGGKITRTKNSNTIFYHTDHLGSVRLITDENGNTIDTISTDAYGNPLPHPDSTGNKGAKMLSGFNFVGTHGIRYVGKVRLHNMRARWYDKLLTKFISTDPIKNRDSKEKTNLYSYSESNPIKYIDITGLDYFNISPKSENTKIHQTKLRCITRILRDICPGIGNSWLPFKSKIELMNLPRDQAGRYNPSNGKVELDLNTFNQRNNHAYLAYIFMEELIHKIQVKHFKAKACPSSLQRQGYTNLFEFLKNTTEPINHPSVNDPNHSIYEYPTTGGIFIDYSRVLFEVWANYSVLYSLNIVFPRLNYTMTNYQQLRQTSNNYIYAYHPVPRGPFSDPYSNFYNLVAAVRLRNTNIPDILRQMPSSSYKLYSRYCSKSITQIINSYVNIFL